MKKIEKSKLFFIYVLLKGWKIKEVYDKQYTKFKYIKKLLVYKKQNK